MSELDSPLASCSHDDGHARPKANAQHILTDVVAYVEVRSGHENRSKAVSRELIHLGAKVEDKFTKDVTHVVFREGRQSTVDRAHKKGVHLVSVLWIESCKTNQAHVSEARFPAPKAEDRPLTPVNVARLKKSKSMQPKDFDEEMSHSAERVAAKHRREKKKERKPRYNVVDTPFHQRPMFFVENTCPRSPDGSIMFSPSLVVPETPPSMKEKIDSLRKAKLIKQEAEYRESPLVAHSDDAEPLQRRLFNFTGGTSVSSMDTECEDPFASSPLFISGSSSTATPANISPLVHRVVSMLESPANSSASSNTSTPLVRAGSAFRPVESPLGAMSDGTPVAKGSVSFVTTESPLVLAAARKGRRSNLVRSSEKTATRSSPRASKECGSPSVPATKSTTPSQQSSKNSTPLIESSNSPTNSISLQSADENVPDVIKTKSRRSILGNKFAAPKTIKSAVSKSSGKKKLLCLNTEPSPELITPMDDLASGSNSTSANEDVSERKKAVAKKRGKKSKPPSRDPAVLFSEAFFGSNSGGKRSRSKKRKKDLNDSTDKECQSHAGAVKRPKIDRCDIEPKTSAPKAVSRRRSTRVSMRISSEFEDIEPLPFEVDTPSPFARTTRRRSQAVQSMAKDPQTNTGERPKNKSPSKTHCDDQGSIPAPANVEDNSPKARPLSNKRESRSISYSTTANRRRSSRFITISSDQPPPMNNILSLSTLSAYEDSLTDVSALNTQNDTLQPSLGTRVALQNVLSSNRRRRSVVKSQVLAENHVLTNLATSELARNEIYPAMNESDISAIDPNLDNESLSHGVGISSVVKSRRPSIELARVSSRNSTLLKNIANTSPVSIIDMDSSANVTPAFPSRNSTFMNLTRSRRSIDEFAPIVLSAKKSSAKKNKVSARNKELESVDEVKATDEVIEEDISNKKNPTKPKLSQSIENRSKENTDKHSAKTDSSEAPTITKKRTNKGKPGTAEMKSKPAKKAVKKNKEETGRGDKRHWKKVVIDHSPHSPPTRTLVMTSLHFDEQDMVMSVVERLGGFEVVETVDEHTTHVVCGGPRRTLNVLNCIARGCWLMSLSWVLESLEAGSWLQEDQYEVDEYFPAAKLSRLEVQQNRQRASLFLSQGLITVCDSARPPKTELVRLIELCGGRVTSVVRNADVCVGSVVKSDIPTVSEQWVLDSITSKKTLPLAEYKLNSPTRVEREPSPDF